MTNADGTKDNRIRVLILCTGNSARSQMTEGLLRHEFGEAFDVQSAGTLPTSVRDEAIRVMSEIGIDISSHHSKHVDRFIGSDFDYVITVCDNARESCPVFPTRAVRIHHSFEDPPPQDVGSDEARMKIFRRVRDEMQEWVRAFAGDCLRFEL